MRAVLAMLELCAATSANLSEVFLSAFGADTRRVAGAGASANLVRGVMLWYWYFYWD